MAKSKADTITVMLGNAQRTSAGDHAGRDVVELPAPEARALIQSGHAVRAPEGLAATEPRAVAALPRPLPSDRPRVVNGQKVWPGFPGYIEPEQEAS